jgi:hypothetical protein
VYWYSGDGGLVFIDPDEYDGCQACDYKRTLYDEWVAYNKGETPESLEAAFLAFELHDYFEAFRPSASELTVREWNLIRIVQNEQARAEVERRLREEAKAEADARQARHGK